MSLPRPLVYTETTLIDPGPPIPDDNDVMNEIVDVASTIAFYFGVRFPDVGCQFAYNSEQRFSLMRCLRFALTMYTHGKARGAGTKYGHVAGQCSRVWDLLQNKYDPVENATEVLYVYVCMYVCMACMQSNGKK